MTIKKILIIHTAFIGDIILLAPLIHETQKAFENADIHLLVIPAVSAIYEHDPCVKQMILYDKKNKDKGFSGFIKIIGKVKRQDYDLAFIPHRSLRSALLGKLAKIPIRIGFDKSAAPLLMTHRVTYQNNKHEVERNIALLESLLDKKIDPEPGLYTSSAQKRKAGQLLQTLEKPVIAIAPGSVWPTKRWPIRYYAALISALTKAEINVIILGGPRDTELAKTLPTNSRIRHLVDQLTLLESAEIIRLCSLLITNDSAPLHLASAMGTPVIAIFGPTVPAFGFYPYKVEHKIIQRSLDCRPCGMHGSVKCPIKTHECMKAIKPKMVLEETLNLLKQQRIYEQNT